MIGTLIWQFIKWHKIIGNWLAVRLFDRPLPPATPQEQELIAALQAELTEAPKPNMLPKWVQFREEVRRIFSEQDPRNFLRFGIIQHTMCVTNSGAVVRELPALRFSAKWPLFRKAVVESPVGNPIRFIYHPESSGNLLHHCYHILRFEEATGANAAKMDLVVEFGGGYGSMCRLFHRLGFKGRYFIYDLPEFSAIQRYFLKSLNLPLRDPAQGVEESGIYLFSDFAQIQRAIDAQPIPPASAFVATWSLSESPIELRDRFLPLVKPFSYFLIAFQDRFEDVDNRVYFEDFRNTTPEVTWKPKALRHLPCNNYLFGHRHA
jgi:hypothetical protein